ncbi:hypothetical protein SELMODRAFT_97190 [Selaginella moellendorffii]|uniref:Uncharacterized protein n=1 Tax=Selaginella moellendorffii TaxID=88036 RepID=D8RND9_SELML|nr:uncharacterized protein LOC112346951 [Selaginella moellendorffii]EFJ26709.1 hypothetical protein SELMODRAFT_97190 [Selaginella moellendorffii]|eukprot:XP_024532759.1 uncharacterized protein LOC112346951 [Selaginella moellendorffii]
MVSTPTVAGAVLGLAIQLYCNGMRKLPLMRHPWEHVLFMGIGAYAINELVAWEYRTEAALEKKKAELLRINKNRPVESLPRIF